MKEQAHISKPSYFLFYTEIIRALFEIVSAIFFQLFHSPKFVGDGHPVLVVPGFLGSKLSTWLLRKFIGKHGYTVYDWGLGRNLANFDELDLLFTRLEYIYKTHREKVSVVGWSLGGIYARELAKRNPGMVRQVITIGAPFNGATRPNHARWLLKWVRDREVTEELSDGFLASLPLPAPVPSTAIFSTLDGIVPWQACREEQEGDLYRNIGIKSSHLGMGWNISVLKIVVDRLRQVGKQGRLRQSA